MLTLGVDLGSTTVKIAFFDGEGFPHTDVLPTGPRPRETLARLLEDAARKGFDYREAALTAATGYGRRLVDFADVRMSEITANAAAVVHETRRLGLSARTIVDIGGQDSKVIALREDGSVEDFVMNDKCAAGTGRFLEVMARILETDVGELGNLDAGESGGVKINATCTVFAESEVVSLIAEGAEVGRIVNALHASIASRIASMAARLKCGPDFVCDGGPALNPGLVRALEAAFGGKFSVPSDPRTMAAKGAALTAARRAGL